MPQLTIKCPYCGEVFPIDEALEEHLRETLSTEVQAELKKRLSKIEERERSLRESEEALSQRAQEIEAQVEERISQARAVLEAEAKQKAQEEQAELLESLRRDLKEQREKLREAQKAEIQLREERQKLEDDRAALELKLRRQLDQERQKIRAETRKTLEEQHALELADREQLITSLKEQIEDLRKRAEQGSQQRQGEVMEVALEELLRDNFPSDIIEPIRSGQRGADIRHDVVGRNGQVCGTILWESKRAKWQRSWIPKLREDQKEARAEIAVLVGTSLPNDVNGFAFTDGVWVCDLDSALGLACALRMHLTELAQVRTAAIGRRGKAEALFEYLHTSDFRQRFEGVVRAFVEMKKELEKEKAAVQAQWARRDKQIERVLSNVAGIYGDLQGIAEGSLPEIQYLEVATLPEPDTLSALPPAE